MFKIYVMVIFRTSYLVRNFYLKTKVYEFERILWEKNVYIYEIQCK